MATTRSVNQYRVFCATEGKHYSLWSEVPPLTCPKNTQHTIDRGQTVVVDEAANNPLPMTSFDELRVAERTRIIELKSIFGKSALRDVYDEVGTGTITNNIGDSEYTLQSSAANDVAWLRSAERGRYVAGLQGEVGIAVRLPQALTGTQDLCIGLFDGNNGFYYKYTSAGLNACVLRDGVETAIPMSQFNYDQFDGLGPSRYTLNFNNGIIYTIRFTWYGYGTIEFRLNTTNAENRQSSWLGHIYQPLYQTSVKNPNLPISVRLRNAGTAGARTAYVAGRQYSLLGKYQSITRTNQAYRVNVAINSTTNFVHIMSIRRKVGYLGNPVKAFGADVLASSDIILQIRVITTNTNPVWQTPNDTLAADTAVEYDIAGAVTGGKPIWAGLITGSSNNRGNGSFDINYDLPEYEVLSIMARGVSATNGTATVVFRWTEEW